MAPADGASRIRLRGDWTVGQLGVAGVTSRLETVLRQAAGQASEWDLRDITQLDHLGALLIARHWGGQRPAQLHLHAHQSLFIDRALAFAQSRRPPCAPPPLEWLAIIGWRALGSSADMRRFVMVIGQFMIDSLTLLRHPARMPLRELSANIHRAGVRALGITALVAFLIGVVLSYLSAQQLRTFGANIYIVDLLGVAVVRELGPLLAAILVAGRSGSSITAQIGVMRVTQELDAMQAMGLPHGLRLIWPRVLALAVVMPLLTVWTDAIALLGGALAAQLELDLSLGYFIRALPGAVALPHYWIGAGKAVVFGALIALIACFHGLRVRPDTDSLGRGVTTSVVSAITAVILVDAVFAIIFKDV